MKSTAPLADRADPDGRTRPESAARHRHRHTRRWLWALACSSGYRTRPLGRRPTRRPCSWLAATRISWPSKPLTRHNRAICHAEHSRISENSDPELADFSAWGLRSCARGGATSVNKDGSFKEPFSNIAGQIWKARRTERELVAIQARVKPMSCAGAAQSWGAGSSKAQRSEVQ